MPYLLDTDTASLAFDGNQLVRRRIQQVQSVWLSSVAAEENVRGALSLINQSRDKPGFPFAHNFLTRILVNISDYQIHPYNAEAALVFASFPASVKCTGSQDCRIAASAIAAGWIVVTANHRHFSLIPGVQFEDWSR